MGAIRKFSVIRMDFSTSQAVERNLNRSQYLSDYESHSKTWWKRISSRKLGLLAWSTFH